MGKKLWDFHRRCARISLSCECVLHRYKSPFNLQNRDDAVKQKCQRNDVVLLESSTSVRATQLRICWMSRTQKSCSQIYNPHIHSVIHTGVKHRPSWCLITRWCYWLHAYQTLTGINVSSIPRIRHSATLSWSQMFTVTSHLFFTSLRLLIDIA